MKGSTYVGKYSKYEQAHTLASVEHSYSLHHASCTLLSCHVDVMQIIGINRTLNCIPLPTHPARWHTQHQWQAMGQQAPVTGYGTTSTSDRLWDNKGQWQAMGQQGPVTGYGTTRASDRLWDNKGHQMPASVSTYPKATSEASSGSRHPPKAPGRSCHSGLQLWLLQLMSSSHL